MQLPHVSAAQNSETIITADKIENLISRLKSPECHTRHTAGAELLQMESPDPRFIDPLIELLATSIDEGVRQSSAYALGKSKDPKALEPLLKALNDPSDRVQSFVLMALWNFQDSKMVMPLMDFLLKTDDYILARDTVIVLLSNADERVVEPLIDSLENRPDSYGAMYGAELFCKVKDPRAVEPLIQFLGKNIEAGFYAVKALDELGDARAVDVLIKTLKNSSSVDIRKAAAESLGKIGDKKAVQPLIEALGDYSLIVKYEVVSALEKINDERATEPLKKFYIELEALRQETNEWVNSPVPGITPGMLSEYLKILNEQ